MLQIQPFNRIKDTPPGRWPGLLLLIYLVAYFFVNLTFLDGYPFVHSDEAWLSGLTRNMMESGSLGVTETFFDLKPRWPHGIKSLFHLLQMPFILVFGYSVTAVRLLSLTFALISLIIFYFFLRTLTEKSGENSNNLPLLGTILLSLNIQFLYASHFARQEIILIAGLLGCGLLILRGHPLAAGLVTGLCIGLHPNSFIIGTMGLALTLTSLRKKPIQAFRFAMGAGIFALFFVSLSFYWDPAFPVHYFQYGNSEFDVGAPVHNKLAEFPLFLEKIWHQVSGTYYVPDIRVWLILFGLTIPPGLLLASFGKSERSSLLFLYRGLLGIFTGMVIIGRYNQTSIIFFLPLFMALLILILQKFFGRSQKKALVSMALLVLIGASAYHSWINVTPWLPADSTSEGSETYERYLEEIGSVVPQDARVLANLNTDYYFENGNLRDVRNLTYLKENGLSVKDYIRQNNIQYIILSDEMDFIYERRPVWNMIYGNPRYVPELRQFAEEQCTLIHQFRDNTYGIRIVGYMRSDLSFTVQIFEVQNLT